jgi:hypothetical protein
VEYTRLTDSHHGGTCSMNKLQLLRMLTLLGEYTPDRVEYKMVGRTLVLTMHVGARIVSKVLKSDGRVL